jgi:hypothetical protein
MRQLIVWNPLLSKLQDQAQIVEGVLVPTNLELPFMGFVREVEARQLLSIQHTGAGTGTRVGAQASIFRISRGAKFDELQALLKGD